MRILHTADWHLGKRLENFSRLPEQEAVLNEICEIAETEQVDVVLIAGDLFDTFNPSTEAIELFYRTLKRLAANGSRAVVAIAGNHDSPERIEAPDPLARACGIILSGFPDTVVKPFFLTDGIAITRSDAGFIELQLPAFDYPLRILLTPYANELRLKKFLGTGDADAALRTLLQQHWQQLANTYCDQKGVNLLLAHLYLMQKDAAPPKEPDAEKPILHLGGAQAIYTENIPAEMHYAALGHLHRKQVIATQPCPVIYSSSPLAYSFSEAGQQKYVMLLQATPGKPVEVKEKALQQGKPLLRFRAENLATALAWLQKHTDALVELTLVTEDFITAEARGQLHATHPQIINIIPELKNRTFGQQQADMPDISRDVRELFVDFFEHRTGQPPNADLLELFNQLLATEETL